MLSSLENDAGHKLSSEITFCATIELLVDRWRSLLWICLVPTITWLNSFAFEFRPYGQWTVLLKHLIRTISRVPLQIINQFYRKSHEYKAIKRYWKLIQQDSRKLSDKRFYRPTFRMHLTNKEILDKLLSYSEYLRHHYNVYQLLLLLLLFHFHNKESDKFFGLIEDNLKQLHPLF